LEGGGKKGGIWKRDWKGGGKKGGKRKGIGREGVRRWYREYHLPKFLK